jgi:hypothetical protein
VATQTDKAIGATYSEQLRVSHEELMRWLGQAAPSHFYEPMADGEWTVLENLAHLVELQPYWAKQAQHVASNPDQPFGRTHDDPVRVGWIEAHGKDAFPGVRPELERANREARDILSAIPDGAWSNKGVHSRRGAMTVREIVESFLTSHFQEHIDQIKNTYEAVLAR